MFFSGSMVAIVTPMLDDGRIDFEAFSRLIDWHIDSNTDALVVVGTTGESPTVSVDEHASLIKHAVEHARGRIPVIAGTGANSTQEAIDLSRYAHGVGASACLSVVPYYNKPTQEGLFQHFRQIAEAVACPFLLYNVPGRTVADIANETVARLAEVPNIVGIKDATGDIGRGLELLRLVPADFVVLSGDDLSSAALMLLGARGSISVTANVAPRQMHALCEAALAGDVPKTRRLNDQLLGLHRHLFVEPNPIPVKWALQTMGLIGSGIRLPLTPLSEAHHARVLNALRDAAVLPQ